jgi:hypothetical protein
MHEVSTVSELAELLPSLNANPILIGIDGRDGAGKTTLAKALGQCTGAAVVSLDDFVAKNRGSYVPHLRTGDLREALSSAGRPAIVEGVCLLAVLEALSLEPDLLVYVKRIRDDGYWYDHDVCDPEEDEETLIERLSREEAAFAPLAARLSGKPEPEGDDPGLSPLNEEIVRYHCRYRPSRRARIVFLRIDT